MHFLDAMPAARTKRDPFPSAVPTTAFFGPDGTREQRILEGMICNLFFDGQLGRDALVRTTNHHTVGRCFHCPKPQGALQFFAIEQALDSTETEMISSDAKLWFLIVGELVLFVCFIMHLAIE